MKTCPYCAEDVRDEALKCKHCGSWIMPPPPGVAAGQAQPKWFSMPTGPRGRLMKSRDKQIDGVCAGFANYFGVDPTWVRLLFALTILLGGVGFIIYLILACVMPNEPDPSKEVIKPPAQELL